VILVAGDSGWSAGVFPDMASVTPDNADVPFYINPAPGTRRVFGVGEVMTGSIRSSDGLDARRRRLLFRSWHRGTREADLIMGRFADAHVEALGEVELEQYEHLLDALETDLLSWMIGVVAVPAEHDTAMFRRVRDFHFRAGR
jgi:antitoxin CptB